MRLAVTGPTATGTLTSSEVYQVGNLLVDPTSTISGTVRVNGMIQVPSTQRVPEPTNTAALVGVGVIGVGFLLRQQRRCCKLASKCAAQ
ncbi:MAG: PEP-CTERM sorting domain-containing protein [Scytonema sp. PMC 1069.18]|nr:PEP-CTERM sorting domain-containing protein [Scytonema sp. PMC 1069.18]